VIYRRNLIKPKINRKAVDESEASWMCSESQFPSSLLHASKSVRRCTSIWDTWFDVRKWKRSQWCTGTFVSVRMNRTFSRCHEIRRNHASKAQNLMAFKVTMHDANPCTK
jgi:hypothetical protein